MKLKSHGVVLYEVKPEVYYALGVVDAMFQERHGQEATLTCARAPRGYLSLHTSGGAADVRTRDWFDWLKWEHRPEFIATVQMVKARLDGRGFDLVLEPDYLNERDLVKRFSDARLVELIGSAKRQSLTDQEWSTLRREVTPHLHVEFDPKKGEILWPFVD